MITSFGYDGELDEVGFAKAVMLAGGVTYSVVGQGDFQATINPSDGTVTFAPGVAVGKGVRVVSSADETLPFAPVGAGSRWDLLALRRDWSTNDADLVVIPGIPGTGAPVIPARRVANAEPWIDDDQPLWLVRRQAGFSAVQELIDLRFWGSNGGGTANHELALTYLDTPGAQVSIGSTMFIRGFDSTGAATWLRLPIRATSEQKNLGASLTGLVVAGNGSHGPVQMKSGQNTDFGSALNGNQYLARVDFPTPFPTALLSVQVTPIHNGIAVGAAMSIDFADRTGFRALVPGSGAGNARSYLWTAWGY